MPESPQHTRRMAPSLRLGTAAAVSLGLCQWTVLPLEVSDIVLNECIYIL